MAELSRGSNAVLAASGRVEVTLSWTSSPSALDVSCFLVGANGKVPSDDYMVFFNQPRDPAAAVALTAPSATRTEFAVELDRLPSTIQRCVFTATLDGAGTFAAVSNLVLSAQPRGGSATLYRVSGAASERALIVGELYRHTSGWKVRAIGQGFNGGLKPLAESFGVKVEAESAPPPAPARMAPSAPAPSPPPRQSAQPSPPPRQTTQPAQVPQPSSPVRLGKIDLLKKKVTVELEKKRLTGEQARIAAVLDCSGSMSALYDNGTVQRAVERVMGVAAAMDDDGTMDVWFFASSAMRAPSVTVNDFEGYVDRVRAQTRSSGGFFNRVLPPIVGGLGHGNDEPKVIADVVRKYVNESPSSTLPAFILFFSDGGVGSDREIARLLTDAARHPIFWQFIGLGNANYGVLERLDTLSGRMVDNANFFALDDLDRVSDEELYQRLLNEFPTWLAAVRRQGILSAGRR